MVNKAASIAAPIAIVILAVVMLSQNLQQSQIHEAERQKTFDELNMATLKMIDTCAAPDEPPYNNDAICIRSMNEIKNNCKDSSRHVSACDDSRIEQIISYRTKSLTTPQLRDVSVMPLDSHVNTNTIYVMAFAVGTAGPDVKSEEITFPDGFDITNAKIVKVDAAQTGFPIGVSTVSGQTLIWTHDIAYRPACCLPVKLTITDVVNGSTLNNQISIVTKDPDGRIIDGPTTATFQLSD